ncbi:MAG: hypothetical protein C0403_06170 [Desulfobacterium sp.]|nr:hypothetical protein [Desulfobacterium sp.]
MTGTANFFQTLNKIQRLGQTRGRDILPPSGFFCFFPDENRSLEISIVSKHNIARQFLNLIREQVPDIPYPRKNQIFSALIFSRDALA